MSVSSNGIRKNENIFNLGLGFRPMPPHDSIESTLIWYKGTKYENYRQWTDALDKFLASMFDLLDFFLEIFPSTAFSFSSNISV